MDTPGVVSAARYHWMQLITMSSSKRAARLARREQGQGLVEFALLLPVFVTAFFGLIEFSLAFNADLNLGYASRNAALLAAEAGNAVGADCVVLKNVESSVTPPAAAGRITGVDVYWANPDGSVVGTNINSYTRTGSTTCTFADGTQLTVPYTATATGYPSSNRCNILKGCSGGHSGLDNVGVRITYSHFFVTPVAKMIGGSAASITLTSASTMRMEPIL